jgi:MoaA/NifB/PqqE/SkfB family radical SAM enzyme
MSLEMVEKIADDCKGQPVKKINLFWFGDSLCHKKVFECMCIIRKKLPKVKLYLSTNAGLLWKDRSQIITMKNHSIRQAKRRNF